MRVDAYQDVTGQVHKTRKESNVASVISILNLKDRYGINSAERYELAETILQKLPSIINVDRDKS